MDPESANSSLCDGFSPCLHDYHSKNAVRKFLLIPQGATVTTNTNRTAYKNILNKAALCLAS